MEKSSEKMNIGIVLKATFEQWRLIEAFLGKNAELVFVKKVPLGVKLRISQEFVRGEGEEVVRD